VNYHKTNDLGLSQLVRNNSVLDKKYLSSYSDNSIANRIKKLETGVMLSFWVQIDDIIFILLV